MKAYSCSTFVKICEGCFSGEAVKSPLDAAPSCEYGGGGDGNPGCACDGVRGRRSRGGCCSEDNLLALNPVISEEPFIRTLQFLVGDIGLMGELGSLSIPEACQRRALAKGHLIGMVKESNVEPSKSKKGSKKDKQKEWRERIRGGKREEKEKRCLP